MGEIVVIDWPTVIVVSCVLGLVALAGYELAKTRRVAPPP